jgi:hypothetical protein
MGTAKVAQDHLAIPAAEVDIGRLFNGGSDVLGIRRILPFMGNLRIPSTSLPPLNNLPISTSAAGIARLRKDSTASKLSCLWPTAFIVSIREEIAYST